MRGRIKFSAIRSFALCMLIIGLLAGTALPAAAQGSGPPDPPQCADLGRDNGNTAADASTLTPEVPQTYAFCTSGDVDWFAVSLEVGIVYEFQVQGTGDGVAPTTALYGPGVSYLTA